MTVTSVHKDPAALSLTITAEFTASVQRVWEMWSNPRNLERWWGPPLFPATVVEHDLTPGGRVRYFMTSPEGDRFHGWWHITAVEPFGRLEFDDGFADDEGNPNPDMPVTKCTATIEDREGVVVLQIMSVFPSAEVMEQMAAMGMEEGITQALGQIDALLAS